MNKYSKLIALLLTALMILPLSCDKEDPKEEQESTQKIILQDNVIIATEEMNDDIVSKDSSSIVFNAGSIEVANIEIGDVIVSGIHDNAPLGYFRKVTNVFVSGSEVILTTTTASLQEVFKECDIDVEYELTADDFDRRANLKVPIDQIFPSISMSGEVELKPTIIYKCKIREGSVVVEEFQLGFITTIDSDIQLSATAQELILKESVTLYDEPLRPLERTILVPVPGLGLTIPFPIILVPHVYLKAELSGKIKDATLTSEYEGYGTIKSCANYELGTPPSIESFNSYEATKANVSMSADQDIKAIVKLEWAFQWYDVKGILAPTISGGYFIKWEGDANECKRSHGVEVKVKMGLEVKKLLGTEFVLEEGKEFPVDVKTIPDCPNPDLCSDSTLSVTISSAPAASGGVGLDLTANVSGGSPPYEFLWVPGAFNTPVYTDHFGSFEVCVIVQDSKGCTASDCF